MKEIIKTYDITKPHFTSCLDHLGPIPVYFLGIDQKLGIIIADQ